MTRGEPYPHAHGAQPEGGAGGEKGEDQEEAEVVRLGEGGRLAGCARAEKGLKFAALAWIIPTSTTFIRNHLNPVVIGTRPLL